jgi:UDP-N-acetylmuramoylalanine--D-glutamate ligase
MLVPGSWADLRGRRVGLWGIGVEGQASLRRLRQDGVEPCVVDQAPTSLDDGTPVLGLHTGGVERLLQAEIVIKSPGISRYGDDCRRLIEAGVPVTGGLALWLGGVDRARVACITGTKGKSTTTSIAGSLLSGLGCSYRISGNIGVCPWDPDLAAEEVDWWLVETSSYQAADLQLGPAVVAVTSLGEDHLPWHGGSVQAYHRDKLSLCTLPGVGQVVANGADPALRARAGLLGPNVDWVDDVAGSWADAGQLLGLHNRRNAEIARRTLLALGVPALDDEQRLAKAFSAFVPLPNRLTPVAQLGGVSFVDDSISTNVVSTIAAVDSFPDRRIGLLVGGLERDIDYRPLAQVAGRPGVRTFSLPTNGPKIAKTLRAEGVEVIETDSLRAATEQALEWARPDGVVLLSPAAASFDLYPDYRARGEAFARIARALAGVADPAG